MELLAQKSRALDAAVWPYGRPSDTHEIPLWQDIGRDWVAKVMKPTCITYLIDELLKSTDGDDPETTHHDITKAVREAGNWRDVLTDLGWIHTDELIREFECGGHSRLIRLVNLALSGAAAEAPPEDERYYWVYRTPTWKDGEIVFVDSLIPWEDMVDGSNARAVSYHAAVADTGSVPEYVLCSVIWHNERKQLEFTDPDVPGLEEFATLEYLESLPQDKFVLPEEAFDKCSHAIADWLADEWLRPHGFVNIDEGDWSSMATWFSLGEELDGGTGTIEERITRNEIAQWFIVSEWAGEHLQATGEVVVPLTGSSNFIWGRDEGGQVLHFDGAVERAMIRSGHFDRVPPLGALNHDSQLLPRGLRVTLGGEEFPFRIVGFSEHRPDRELAGVILDPGCREKGWCVIWGPTFESESEGTIRTFRLSAVTPEGHEAPEFHEG